MIIALAESDTEIEHCFTVAHELRPHLIADAFVAQIRRQQEVGYHLAYLEEADTVYSLAGFRILESLAWEKYLYVDDLITAADARSKGYAQTVFEWVIRYARERHCGELHLDSGVHRFAAHRFYLRQRMDITCHHFSMKL